MLGQSGYSRAMLPNVREIETRLRSLEQRLERVGGRTSASTAEVAERAGAAIAPVLSSIADRFRSDPSLCGKPGRRESDRADQGVVGDGRADRPRLRSQQGRGNRALRHRLVCGIARIPDVDLHPARRSPGIGGRLLCRAAAAILSDLD